MDHGLYRTLDRDFRLDYAHFWNALIQGDEKQIEHYAYRLFLHDDRVSINGIDHHRLFASMISGRTWDKISSSNSVISNLAQPLSRNEISTISTHFGKPHFMVAITDILAKLPRELLLLLKTNDLLRAIDTSLGLNRSTDGVISGYSKHMIRMMTLMGWYCIVSIRDGSLGCLEDMNRASREAGNVIVLTILFNRVFWSTWITFIRSAIKLVMIRLVLFF